MWTCVACFSLAMVFMIFFRPKYKRLEFERQALLSKDDEKSQDDNVPIYG